ncbi:hypothetical protein ACFQ0M_12865 [Kitasatospora aburaviensis]
MPQISVDYSPELAGSFDRRELGLAINRLAVKTINASPEACKTVFREVQDFVVGESAGPDSQVYVEFQIFPAAPRRRRRRSPRRSWRCWLSGSFPRPAPGCSPR